MRTGIVFDIKEFAVFDGPGIRTTVFMKGCPLRCQWCHNPEGLSMLPQLLISTAACSHCGTCTRVCTHDPCISCGDCVPYCRQGLRRIAGTAWTSQVLAERLLKDKDILRVNGGGVTFSGGEPLMQWDFVREVISRMPGMHTAIETSGFATDGVFQSMMDTVDLVLMDVKLMDADMHKHYTGVDNACILSHAQMLRDGDTPFIIRIPLIPGVNDTLSHFEGVAALVEGARQLVRVELLPYHQTAGAKYAMAGMAYTPQFDVEQFPRAMTEPFTSRGIEVLVL